MCAISLFAFKRSGVGSVAKQYSAKKRIKVMTALFMAGVLVLVIKLAWIQFVKEALFMTEI